MNKMAALFKITLKNI